MLFLLILVYNLPTCFKPDTVNKTVTRFKGRKEGRCMCVCVRERERGRGKGGERGREGEGEGEQAYRWCSLVCMLIVKQHMIMSLCTCMHDEK